MILLQYIFSELLCEEIDKRWDMMKKEKIDGIILTGGCALVSEIHGQLCHTCNTCVGLSGVLLV